MENLIGNNIKRGGKNAPRYRNFQNRGLPTFAKNGLKSVFFDAYYRVKKPPSYRRFSAPRQSTFCKIAILNTKEAFVMAKDSQTDANNLTDEQKNKKSSSNEQ
jgi:hypothetical protein